jgi:hypothetical protein
MPTNARADVERATIVTTPWFLAILLAYLDETTIPTCANLTKSKQTQVIILLVLYQTRVFLV